MITMLSKLSAMSKSIRKVGKRGLRLNRLSCRRRLNRGRRRHRFNHQLRRYILDPLQIKRIKQLKWEDDLLQLDGPIHPLKDAGAAGDCQVGVLVGEVGALNGNVAVIAEVEAVHSLVSVALLLRRVLDQNT